MKPNKAAADLVTKKYAKQSQFRDIFRRLLKNKGSMAGMIIIAAMVLCVVFSALFISYEMVTKASMRDMLIHPNLQQLFGTDQFGRNFFYRVIYGARYSLAIGFGGSLIAVTIGVFLGCIAGYYGGAREMLIMRAAEVLTSIPGTLLGMVIMSALSTTLPNLVFCVGVTSIPIYVRMARASILSLRNQEFVEASHAIGLGSFRIIFTRILPNGLSPLIVTFTMNFGVMILVASGLSFLGFGIALPRPEWGALVSESREYMRNASYLLTIPGVFIMLTVLAFNMFGDGLRDALDPKLKR